MAHDLVTEVLRVGRDGGHRTIGNSVDGTGERNIASQIAFGVSDRSALRQRGTGRFARNNSSSILVLISA
jgi:hypothetical protein